MGCARSKAILKRSVLDCEAELCRAVLLRKAELRHSRYAQGGSRRQARGEARVVTRPLRCLKVNHETVARQPSFGMAPQWERLDARAMHRVRRPASNLARRHSDSASTCTILAEGSSAVQKIRKGRREQRSGTLDSHRGFIG